MYFQTRSQLSQNDFEFIAQTLGKSPGEQEALLRIADDPYAVTELLHDDRLFERAMTRPPVFMSISHSLFFYIVMRRALSARRLDDDDVVDYVAGICVEFRTNANLWALTVQPGEKMVSMVDMLNLMNDLGEAQRYYMRRHIGNVALFLTGFFPGFIVRRSRTIGAPPMAYYERLGSAQFGTAAGQSAALDGESAPVLSTLADRFVEIRTAINVFTAAHLSIG